MSILRATSLTTVAAVRAVGPAVVLRAQSGAVIAALSTVSGTPEDATRASLHAAKTPAEAAGKGIKAIEEKVRPGERSQVKTPLIAAPAMTS